MPAVPAHAVAFRERLLLIVLFITVLASSVAFIEPSPHDALIAVLLVFALIAGVRLERTLLVPFLLLLIWNVAGMMALLHVPGLEKTVQYTATSIYLALAGLLFAGLFAQNTMARLATMRVAYIITAVIASFIGMAGYFDVFGLATCSRRSAARLAPSRTPMCSGRFASGRRCSCSTGWSPGISVSPTPSSPALFWSACC